MAEDLKKRGGTIRLHTSLLRIEPQGDLQTEGLKALIKTDSQPPEWLEAKRIVLAMDATSLKHMRGMTALIPALKHLTSEPLLRTYAVFPSQGGDKNRTPWFSDLPKQVVPTPIRFFIPMDASRGLAMISYTEGRDAEHWMSIKNPKKREQAMMAELRRTFPAKEIPDPILIKFHPWQSGCTYWTPPNASNKAYDVEEESDKSVEPVRRLYVCSESFAVQQSWMESALVQAEKVLERLLP
jgi:hypothetical protein